MNITRRFYVTQFITTGILVASMALAVHWSLERRFLDYINYIEQVRVKQLADDLGRCQVSCRLCPDC